MNLRIIICILWLMSAAACRPPMPATSSITVDAEALSIPVNKELYGLTIEEINHAVEGGIYAELIQNRNFEEGILPPNCRYDARSNMLITPNGWNMPFIRPDSVPGWRRFSSASILYPDMNDPISENNRRSLLVIVPPRSNRGGAVAEGYGGIPLRKGEKYGLTFYAKRAMLASRTIDVALTDLAGEVTFSDIFHFTPGYTWEKYTHTFTAKEDVSRAVLAFSVDTAALFRLDMVSLFPQQTWKGRRNGLRPDLMELIAALNPKFIRFPGGSFVEGYTAGTFPLWKETVGELSARKSFWNVWGYGTGSGMGFHEYLRMCEDLGAEPVYVVNSGVTGQSRRPRYEDITRMDRLVQDVLDAIAYANQPPDSVWGAMRAKHGHREPFGLKYIEIGSENHGHEYAKRFALFKKAINEKYPEITVISSSFLPRKNRSEWADTHWYAGDLFLISNHNRYVSDWYVRRTSPVFIGEFGLTGGAVPGSLGQAIAEACFMIGVENGQDAVRRLAYAPILGNSNFEINRFPAILYDGKCSVLSPSYHVWQLFTQNRGEEVLKTEVNTYNKPQVTFGRAGFELFGNSFEIEEVALDGQSMDTATVMRGGWTVDKGLFVQAPNRWNYILTGDLSGYDYSFSAKIRRTKGNGPIQVRVRDNGLTDEQEDFIGWEIGNGVSDFFRKSGSVKDTLCLPVDFPFENNRWYTVRITCKEGNLACFVDDARIHDVQLPAIPSLVATSAIDRENNLLIMKVVNTTHHVERTELYFSGLRVENRIEVIRLTGDPEAGNSFEKPHRISPQKSEFTFPLTGVHIYDFPPNSITLLKWKLL